VPGTFCALGVHPVHPEIGCCVTLRSEIRYLVRLRPNSRLTFCTSGVPDAQDAQDASSFFC